MLSMIGRDMPTPKRSAPPRSLAGLMPMRALARDRQGATAAFFGVAITVVVGFAGLATEAGRWYDVRRDMQDVADMAVLAAATRYQQVNLLSGPGGSLQGQGGTNQTQATAAANDVGRANAPSGNSTYFTSGMAVTFPGSVNAITSSNLVQVQITRNENRLISRLFMTGQQQIVVSAVAGVFTSGTACVLALGAGATGSSPNIGLRIQGNSTNNADTCVYASNATGTSGININGNPTLNIAALYSAGGCNSCSSYASTLPGGVDTNQPAIPDPFDYLAGILNSTKRAALNLSSYPGNEQPCNKCAWTVPSGSMRNDTSTPNPIGPYYVFTNTLRIGTGNGPDSADLLPGTYFFVGGNNMSNGAGLNMTGGSLTCSTCTSTNGVSLVFLNVQSNGSNGVAGQISVNGNATLNLNAPPATSSSPFKGVLLWRMPPADGSTEASGKAFGNAEVSIEGTAASRLGGGVYAPRADMSWLGNSSMTANSNCLVLVGGAITMGGNNVVTGTNSSGCGSFNPNMVPRSQVVRLMM